jgi:indolepyruvate ferredoxin oxidoreductase beta subunit
MKSNIILSGVGGQGILTIAAVIDIAALMQNLHIKQSEVHGMSQRGGAVQSHVRISDQEIYSDLIPMGQADLILSVEPMELLRYIPYLNKKGWIVTDSSTFENILDYPDKHDLFRQIKTYHNHVILNAKQEAKRLGNSKVANMILLGAASSFMPLDEDHLIQAIQVYFKGKSKKIADTNIKAFKIGQALCTDYLEFVF